MFLKVRGFLFLLIELLTTFFLSISFSHFCLLKIKVKGALEKKKKHTSSVSIVLTYSLPLNIFDNYTISPNNKFYYKLSSCTFFSYCEYYYIKIKKIIIIT